MNESNLKLVENSVRDLINFLFLERFGLNWEERIVKSTTLAKWGKKLKREKSREGFVTSEARLIYYSEFRDLKDIIVDNWTDFEDIFLDKERFSVFWDILSEYRNPYAHHREWMPHQKELVSGISTEIRTLIARYRSKRETGEDHFPYIESVQDNFGNTWIRGQGTGITTHTTLHLNDVLEFIINAVDPREESLEFYLRGAGTPWQKENSFKMTINESQVGRLGLVLQVRSIRQYHRIGSGHDDQVHFTYLVLPPI